MPEVFVVISVGSEEDVTEEYITAELVVANRRLEICCSKKYTQELTEDEFVSEFGRILNEAKLFSDKLLIPLVFDADELLESVEGNLYLEKQIKQFAKEILK